MLSHCKQRHNAPSKQWEPLTYRHTATSQTTLSSATLLCNLNFILFLSLTQQIFNVPHSSCTTHTHTQYSQISNVAYHYILDHCNNLPCTSTNNSLLVMCFGRSCTLSPHATKVCINTASPECKKNCMRWQALCFS
jgi:hypothetical protein